MAGPSSTVAAASKNAHAAVSVTKKRASSSSNNNSRCEDDEDSSSAGSGELCSALYIANRKKDNTATTQNNGIWWPALRYPSVADFQKATQGRLFPNNNTEDSHQANKEAKKKRKRLQKKLVKRVLKEALGGSPIETLLYLGRPLEDYVTADEALQSGIEVQELAFGLGVLAQQVNSPVFSRQFELATSNIEESYSLFCDYYKGMDELYARAQVGSDDDSDSEDETPIKKKFSPQAESKWRDYHEHHKQGLPQQQEASPKPILQAQDFDEEEEDEVHHLDDQSIAAQSAAAVSYTEASLAPKPHCPTPPKLEEEIIEARDDFETIWHKHQMEGWDRFLGEDETMVYKAPNGYRFDSHQDFLDYLKVTYGFSQQRKKQKPRGRSRERQQQPQATTRGGSTSRSRSRSRDKDQEGGRSWSDLWLYLNRQLGWKYDWATNQDMKDHGIHTTAIWFRPGFDKHNRGTLGRDHFVSEDSVMEYCLEHNIQPLESEQEQDEEDDSDRDMEEDEESRDVPVDDPGYATPDDQSTTPQDPGKPRLDSGASGGSSHSGGSHYSYDDDPDRYEFPILWDRLKAKGWYWIKAKNQFQDYWYAKPASIRPESEWMEGVDYFVSEEELVEFCKKRDKISMGERERRRNKIRNEALLEQQQLQQELLRKEQETKKTKKATASPLKKKKDLTKTKALSVAANYSQNASDNQTQINHNTTAKKRRGSSVDSKKAKSSSKKLKGSKKKKRTKRKPKREGASCGDENLRIRDNTAPWVRKMPRYEHKLCIKATGIQWASGFYYLPKETARNFTIRFANVEEVAKYLARNGCMTWPSGGTEPSTDEERDFDRLIRYSLVPGLQSSWTEIRLITRSETSFLLRKLGYTTDAAGHWKPPVALVVADLLRQEYESLEALCEALWCLDGDLQTPPDTGSRRARKQESIITDIQLTALRLRMAEGFTEADNEENLLDNDNDHDENSISDDSFESDEQSQPENTPVAKKDPSSVGKEGKKRKREKVQDKTNDAASSASSQPTAKEFGADEEEQMAMSPCKIKVGKFRKNPEENTAPWAIDPSRAPKGGWTKLYFKMGITYQNGNYYLPGESSKNFTMQFTKVDDIGIHICTEGNYEKYLSKLDTREEKRIVERHFNYGHVPGNSYEWRKLRYLELNETIAFLTLLGFEKGDGPYGWWKIPEGVPILEESSYPTLSALGKALVRLPDLSDRTMGMSSRRRSRQTEEEQVLSDYQIMALRLRLAEGLEDEVLPAEEDDDEDHGIEIPDEELMTPQKQRRKSEGDRPLLRLSTETIAQVMSDTSNHANAWKYFQNLGCTYSVGRYRVPGIDTPCESQNALVDFILQHTVEVLDWEHCTLVASEIDNLVRYLEVFYVRCSQSSVLETALKMVTKNNIRRCLAEIGVNEDDGQYFIGSKEYSESDIVNKIRSSDDLQNLRYQEMTFTKRRRGNDNTLSKLDVLALRLWAAFSEIPLTNMPDASMIGTATGSNDVQMLTPSNHEESPCEAKEGPQSPRITANVTMENETDDNASDNESCSDNGEESQAGKTQTDTNRGEVEDSTHNLQESSPKETQVSKESTNAGKIPTTVTKQDVPMETEVLTTTKSVISVAKATSPRVIYSEQSQELCKNDVTETVVDQCDEEMMEDADEKAPEKEVAQEPQAVVPKRSALEYASQLADMCRKKMSSVGRHSKADGHAKPPQPADPLDFPTQSTIDLTSPSPAKKSRRSYGSGEQSQSPENAFYSPLSSSKKSQNSNYATPRQNNGIVSTGIEEAEKKALLEQESALGFSNEEYVESLQMLTQADDEDHTTPARNSDNDNSLRDMIHPAELSPSDSYSPLPTRNYDQNHHRPVFGLLTQADCIGDENEEYINQELFSFH